MKNIQMFRYFSSIPKRFESDQKWLNWLVLGWCIVWACFQIWTARIPMDAFYQRSIHFLFGYTLVFLTLNWKGKEEHRFRWEGLIFVVLTFICIVYAVVTWSTKAQTRGYDLPMEEMVLGVTFMFVTLELCRRSVGLSIPILTVLFIIHAACGEYLPGILGHRNYGLERMVTSFYISLEGIMGPLAHVSTTFIFIFVLFGSFLRTSGGGDFYVKFAYAIFGHVRGGPGKIAVIASGLFGMISGSTVANVAGVGPVTIPLMKKYGYPAYFAAAVEATASSGGQIMPPVMGGAAFIMCEILGVSYPFVMKSAVLIAILFYLSIFIWLDIQAQHLGLKGISKNELPRIWPTLKEGWFFLFPPLILIFLMSVVKFSAVLSGLYGTLSIIVFSWLNKNTRMGLKEIVMGMEDACYAFRTMVSVLAAAGLMVAVIGMTGLGLSLSGMLIDASYGSVPILLFLTMIAALILGMGMPITASYVILAVLVAPALISLGVLPIAAHLFIFYFAILADITPPLAPSAFVAAAIAEAPVMKTAMAACKIGLIGLILPFVMIYDQRLLMMGNFYEIIYVFLKTVLGMFALGAAISGYFFHPINLFFRLCLLGSAIVIIKPGLLSDLVGLAVFFIIAWFCNPIFYVEIPRKYLLKYLFPKKMGLGLLTGNPKNPSP